MEREQVVFVAKLVAYLLIIVGVALDTLQQIESHLMSRHYDGFLTKGKIRGRRRM